MRFLILSLVCLFSACEWRVPREKAVVLDVAGRTVTLQELESFVGLSVQQDTQVVSDDLMAAFFEQMIEEQLLLKAADDAGIVPDREKVAHKLEALRRLEPAPAVPSHLDDDALKGSIERQARIEQLVETNVLSALSVSDEEVAKYFEEHAEDFARPETVDVSQILVDDAELATELRWRLLGEPGAFEELARENSLGPEAVDGGHLGTFSPGELPESFETEVFSLAPGKLSDVVTTDFGFHIFRVNARREAEALLLDDVEDVIRVELLRLKSDEAMERYLAELKRRYPVKVFQENLGFAFLEPNDLPVNEADNAKGAME
ncbi:MAG TPA: peptidyl-prolyl cis-trans isomerase [Vicinamibacteria bacterium]|nr:peptidyl-prolyl cis-trans isomerase [Vicinamibacteria bacterium]